MRRPDRLPGNFGVRPVSQTGSLHCLLKMSSSSFEYRSVPLDAGTGPDDGFRILNLLPGCSVDKLRCELYVASLSQPPPFEALSYTWGDPKGDPSHIIRQRESDTHLIFVGEESITVGENLTNALKTLRHESDSRSLWADATSRKTRLLL